MSLSLTILTIFVFIMFEAFFEGSEIAIISYDKVKIRYRARKGHAWAKLILNLKQNPEKLFGTTLLGSHISVITATVLTTIALIFNCGEEYEYLTFFLLSPLTLLFGQIFPKIYFQHNQEKLLPKISHIIFYISTYIFRPFVFILSKTSKIVLLLFGKYTTKGPFVTRDDLKLLVKETHKKSDVKSSERRMINKIFYFHETNARQAMVPLIEVQAMNENTTVDEAIKFFQHGNYSRIPVYAGRIDNIIGIMNSFDLLFAGADDKLIKKFIRSASYVPETQPIDELLLKMRKEGLNMCVVVDEYGGATGLITIEDILEEVVGEIEDEYDEAQKLYNEIEKDTYLIDSRMEIDQINEVMRLNLPKGSYETLGGFIQDYLKRIPKTGECFRYKDFIFTIKYSTSRAIREVLVKMSKENG